MKYRNIYFCLISALCLSTGFSACTNEDEEDYTGITTLESITTRLGDYEVSGRSMNPDEPTRTKPEDRIDLDPTFSIRLDVRISGNNKTYQYRYSATNQCWEPVNQDNVATFAGYGEYDVEFMLRPTTFISQNGSAKILVAADTLISKVKMSPQTHIKDIVLTHKNTLLDITFDEDAVDGFGILPGNTRLNLYQKNHPRGRACRISNTSNRFQFIVQPNKNQVDLELTSSSPEVNVSIPLPEDGFAPNTIYKIKVVKNGNELVVSSMDVLPWSEGSNGGGTVTPQLGVTFSIEGIDRAYVEDNVNVVVGAHDGSTFNTSIEWIDNNTFKAYFDATDDHPYGGYLVNMLEIGMSQIFIGRAVDGSTIELKMSTVNNIDYGVQSREITPGIIGIGTIAELDWVNFDRNANYLQTHNLDFRGYGRSEPIITGVFTGTYNGGNKKIYNLRIAGDDNCALFSINSGTLKNIHLASGSVTSAKGYAAGICANLSGGTIEHCTNEAEIISQLLAAGGIAATLSGGNSAIRWCVNKGYICTKTNMPAAGIFGECSPSISIDITGCINSGTIVSEAYAGGITGQTLNALLTACYNTGFVEGKGATGGISGNVAYNTRISTCYNTGKVSGPAGKTGTFVGRYSSKPVIIGNSYALNNEGTFFGDGSSDTNFHYFSETAWPVTSGNEWTIGTGGNSGLSSWKSLGSWNHIAPVYPRLWFE